MTRKSQELQISLTLLASLKEHKKGKMSFGGRAVTEEPLGKSTKKRSTGEFGLYGLGQTSPNELDFGVEFGSGVISLTWYQSQIQVTRINIQRFIDPAELQSVGDPSGFRRIHFIIVCHFSLLG
ncbi:hypothetical protein MTR67_036431 [Solanum verrucosum]|uniref:Uncharacterized protein n=1 Tax=Solanum verrucosum TaxID=315347 RepID=A0AAF0UCI8_SOLVR|nr:hypothetical protein MTR67_036431 [Solanum verrucosum]